MKKDERFSGAVGEKRIAYFNITMLINEVINHGGFALTILLKENFTAGSAQHM